MLWAEGMSCQMEYKYLAHATGRTEYYEKVEAVMTLMYNAQVTDGLFPTLWSTSTGLPINSSSEFHSYFSSFNWILDHVSVGAFADSAYEYLLKQYLLTERSEQRAVDLCKSQ
jgi:mannosyl-oligosaccharide alpha-1,2-mannosidase